MNIAAWIASGLLAVAYLATGGITLLTTRERLSTNASMASAAREYSLTSIKLIGCVEIVGGR